MKIHNQKITPPKPREIVIYRDPPIKFLAQAVLDFSEFEVQVERPKPPMTKNVRTGEETFNLEDPNYLKKLDNYVNLKTAWMTIKSLSATKGLTWDTIDLGIPNTWPNIDNELREVFTPQEINVLLDGIGKVNAPTKESYEEAIANFPEGQVDQSVGDQESTKDEPTPTPSGERASV